MSDLQRLHDRATQWDCQWLLPAGQILFGETGSDSLEGNQKRSGAIKKVKTTVKNSGVHLIKIINWGWLVIVLVGIPAVSSIEFGAIRLTSLSTSQALTLWGVGLAAGFNGIASFWLARRARTQRLFLIWLTIHLALFLFCWLLFHGHVQFDWLKDFLLWLKDTFTPDA